MQALRKVSDSTVFTTHTPVAAGNDTFHYDLIDKYFSDYWKQLGLDREEFHLLAKEGQPWGPTFGMTVLALNVLGWVEAKFGLKPVTMSYEIKGKSAPEILEELNEVVEEAHHSMRGLQVRRSQDLSRVVFTLTCTLPEHHALQAKLKMHPNFETVTTFNTTAEE